MEFKTTVKNNTVCVDKVTDPGKVVVFPAQFEGHPVTELGPYVLSGAETEEVFLPPDIMRIGAYAFYNCFALKVIHCYGRAIDLGAGVFAADREIKKLDLTEFPGERSCLKEILSEIPQTLRVRIRELTPETYSPDEYENPHVDASREARLIFPEYYEESVENTPARQLVYEMHGCGQRYRYSFKNRNFCYDEYDRLFPYAQTEADEDTVAELALCRVFWPRELCEKARESYVEYLRAHYKSAARILIDADLKYESADINTDAEMLPRFLEEILKPDEEQIHIIIDLAQRCEDTQMVSYLMDLNHQNRGKGGTPAGSKKSRARRFELI